MGFVAQEFYRLASLHTYIGGIAMGIFLPLQIYRAPRCQAKIPEKFRWEKIPLVRQYAILISLAGIGGVLAAMSSGLSGWDAIKAGVAAAQTLILTNLAVDR